MEGSREPTAAKKGRTAMGMLRLWLAVVVVDAHFQCISGYQTPGPEIAVRVFFAISGFYMAMVWERHYAGKYIPFIQSRWMRFFPPYILVCCLTLASLTFAAWHWGVLQGPYSLMLGQGLKLSGWAKALVETTGVTLAGQEWCQFLRIPLDGSAPYVSMLKTQGTAVATNFQLLPQAWTLGLEESFCLTLPLWLSMRNGTLWSLLVASLLIQTGLRLEGLSTFMALLPPPLALCSFFSGILAWRLHASRKAPYGRAHRILLLLFAAALLLCDYIPTDVIHKVSVLALGLVFILGPLFEWSKDMAWDRWIGNLSYPLYLSHFLVGWSVQAWSQAHGTSHDSWVLPLSLGMAWLLWRVVIRPLDGWRKRFWVAGA
jgi:peptidoglycan/LPS O-acetylase OafA/YrhL